MERNTPKISILTIPNLLTILRIILIPLVVIFLSFSNQVFSFIAALFFSLAAFTDWLDGFIARRRKVITPLGKLLDPIADKLLVSVSLIMLLSLGRVPGWMVVIIVGREIIVTGLRWMALKEGVIISASSAGKYKTIFQMVSLIGLILHYEYYQLDFQAMGMFFLWIALILTIYSGLDYFYRFFKKDLLAKEK